MTADALFVRGQCSACGQKAQKRINDDTWFHVDVYNDYSVHRPVQCGSSSQDAEFVERISRRGSKRAPSVEPHYREIVEKRMDYDHVNKVTGEPEPILRDFRQPILCTCTNPSCPGWGKPLPDFVQEYREGQ